ncbi:MAG TPA: hypothetical protein VKX17_27720 [Planctomycetota bacterium]|nr:hypothetical protein [Planctomycetota bacterium]
MNIFPLTPGVVLNVLIVGPIAARNECLAELIADPDRVVVVDTVTKMRHALLLAEWEKPDVVLLDPNMAGDALSQTISLLKEIAPPPAVIVLALEAPLLLRSRCLELGARHVFDETTELDSLFAALQTLRNGKTEASSRKHHSILHGSAIRGRIPFANGIKG